MNEVVVVRNGIPIPERRILFQLAFSSPLLHHRPPPLLLFSAKAIGRWDRAWHAQASSRTCPPEHKQRDILVLFPSTSTHDTDSKALLSALEWDDSLALLTS